MDNLSLGVVGAAHALAFVAVLVFAGAAREAQVGGFRLEEVRLVGGWEVVDQRHLDNLTPGTRQASGIGQ